MSISDPLFLIAQGLAAATFVTDAMGLRQQTPSRRLYWLTASTLLLSSHYYLLGEMVPAAILLVASLRNIVGVFVRGMLVTLVFLSLGVGIGAYLYTGTLDLLPIVRTIMMTLATFAVGETTARWWYLGAAVTIMIYNVLIFTPIAVLVAANQIVNNLIGWRRLRNREI